MALVPVQQEESEQLPDLARHLYFDVAVPLQNSQGSEEKKVKPPHAVDSPQTSEYRTGIVRSSCVPPPSSGSTCLRLARDFPDSSVLDDKSLSSWRSRRKGVGHALA